MADFCPMNGPLDRFARSAMDPPHNSGARGRLRPATPAPPAQNPVPCPSSHPRAQPPCQNKPLWPTSQSRYTQNGRHLSGPKAIALGQRLHHAQARSRLRLSGRRISRTSGPSPFLSPEHPQPIRDRNRISHFYICKNQIYSSMNRLLIACECATSIHIPTHRRYRIFVTHLYFKCFFRSAGAAARRSIPGIF